MILETDAGGAKGLRFQPGPIFAHLVLADEINRATPKTQSALLEAMQERTVTCGTTTHDLEAPFLVMATQNPIEMEGTYPLPEAQLDRFLMKILVDYPSRDELNRIVERTIQREEIHSGAGHGPRGDPRSCARCAGRFSSRPMCRISPSIWSWRRSRERGTRTRSRTSTSAMAVRRAARKRWWNAAACMLR